jgi:hypothetical protein
MTEHDIPGDYDPPLNPETEPEPDDDDGDGEAAEMDTEGMGPDDGEE